MAYEFQVAVDCADPHTLADWWAETLGWQVEPSDEAFIRRMISEGYAAEGDTKLHNGVLVWKDGSAIRHPEGLQRAPRLLFQLVPEPKTVKNRMHLDVRIGADDVESAVAGLVARGATFLHNGVPARARVAERSPRQGPAVSAHRRRTPASPCDVSDPYSRSRATPPSGNTSSRTWVTGREPGSRNRCGVSGSNGVRGSSGNHAPGSSNDAAVASIPRSAAAPGGLPM